MYPKHRIEQRVSGLDSIRFLAALWVFFSHEGVPATIVFGLPGALETLVRGVYGSVWAGSAAVGVFFLLSGFCIHFPYAASSRRLNLGEFYTRRLLRLAIPLAVVLPIGKSGPVLWSLIAEVIYYALYPALRAVHKSRCNWKSAITISFAAAMTVNLSQPGADNMHTFGPWLTWIVALPSWLLGCNIAESIKRGEYVAVSATELWMWRLLILGVAALTTALRFHTPVGYCWTIPPFTLLAAQWLRREIFYRRSVPAPQFLESAGSWSYSLYLVHLPLMSAFDAIAGAAHQDLAWIPRIMFVLLGSYIFSLLVERPSHTVARAISRRFPLAATSERSAILHRREADTA